MSQSQVALPYCGRGGPIATIGVFFSGIVWGRGDMANTRGSFGDLLRHYRTLAGMSQEALAERAGLTANAIGSLERGERRRPHPPHDSLAGRCPRVRRTSNGPN